MTTKEHALLESKVRPTIEWMGKAKKFRALYSEQPKSGGASPSNLEEKELKKITGIDLSRPDRGVCKYKELVSLIECSRPITRRTNEFEELL